MRGTSARGTLIAALAVAAAVAQSNGVTGQPYSAHEETETVQTLADGTHIAKRTAEGDALRRFPGPYPDGTDAGAASGIPGCVSAGTSGIHRNR